VVKKREVCNGAKLSVFKSILVAILTFGHGSWVMIKRMFISSASGIEGIYARVNCGTSRQSAQLWNSNVEPFYECRALLNVEPFYESSDRSYAGLAMCLECRRKNGKASPVGYTYGKADKRSSKDQVEGLNLRTFMVPSWCGCSCRTVWDCCWPWGISRSPKAAVLMTILREKTGMKMN